MTRLQSRLAGAAALAGGALRIANSFTADRLDASVLALCYLATDVLLLGGLSGIYFSQRAALGRWGLLGFLTGVVGLAVIRVAALAAPGGYLVGASLLLAAMAILGVVQLARGIATLAPVLWLAALGLGIASSTIPQQQWIPAAAGVAFGLGFVIAGGPLLAGARAKPDATSRIETDSPRSPS